MVVASQGHEHLARSVRLHGATVSVTAQGYATCRDLVLGAAGVEAEALGPAAPRRRPEDLPGVSCRGSLAETSVGLPDEVAEVPGQRGQELSLHAGLGEQ
ncbi:unnamed protein product [Ixodes hexagonus]